MGYELERFVDIVPEEYLCAICNLVVKDPLESTACDHIYCTACINGWLALDESCPDDRTPLKPDDLRSPGRLIQRLLNKLRIKCDYCKYCTLYGKSNLK